MDNHSKTAPRALNGKHILAIFVAFFGIVIAVNVTMARLAIGTFGGTVVDNSYVASQHFNRWIEQGEADRALGWTSDVSRQADGTLRLTLRDRTDAPIAGAIVVADARHPLGAEPDRIISLSQTAPGIYASSDHIPAGRWQITVTVRHQGRSVRIASAIS